MKNVVLTSLSAITLLTSTAQADLEASRYWWESGQYVEKCSSNVWKVLDNWKIQCVPNSPTFKHSWLKVNVDARVWPNSKVPNNFVHIWN
jgi:hypothetical protein